VACNRRKTSSLASRPEVHNMISMIYIYHHKLNLLNRPIRHRQVDQSTVRRYESSVGCSSGLVVSKFAHSFEGFSYTAVYPSTFLTTSFASLRQTANSSRTFLASSISSTFAIPLSSVSCPLCNFELPEKLPPAEDCFAMVGIGSRGSKAGESRYKLCELRCRNGRVVSTR